ncbi:LysR family transcriptional regulator [Micromonospora maritima]|uniref:LysR family transcriptional regulator n=1 Tax=Micromonospora maritima TaxID=986711 RepID=A0ABW7ZJB0_9ACTN
MTGPAADAAQPPGLHTVDWRDLTAFRIVAEELSFARAGRRLSLSGPAVSRRVRRLEQRCRVELLHRTTRYRSLTLPGHRLLEAVHRIDDHWWQLLRVTTAPVRSRNPQPALASIPTDLRLTTYTYAFGRLLRALSARWPATTVRTVPFDYDGSVRDLLADRVRFVIGYELPHAPIPELDHVEHQTLLREPVWVAMGADHRLAGTPDDALDLAGLRDEAWITHPEPRLRELLEQTCRDAGFTPRVRHVTADISAMRSLTASGAAITLAAPTVPPRGEIVVRPFVGMPVRRLYLAWNGAHVGPRTAGAFHDFFCDFYRREVEESAPDYWRYIRRRRAAFPTVSGEPGTPDSPSVRSRDEHIWRAGVTDTALFGAVAQTLSFARAAALTGVSGPTLSRRVARLERQLDTRLLQRSTHGMALTSSGHDVLAVSERIRGEWARAWATIATG